MLEPAIANKGSGIQVLNYRTYRAGLLPSSGRVLNYRTNRAGLLPSSGRVLNYIWPTEQDCCHLQVEF